MICWGKRILCQINHVIQYALIRTLQAMSGDWEKNPKLEKHRRFSILVIRLDEIGDMVLMSPFLRELRRNFPKAHITLVVNSVVYNIVELCPYVDEILQLKRSRGRFAFYSIVYRTLRFAWRYLRKKQFDLAIVPRFDSDRYYGASLLAFFSGAKSRVGYSEHVLHSKMILDRGYDGLYTDVLQSDRNQICHEVERNLDVLRFLGNRISDSKLEIWTNEQDEIKAERILLKYDFHDKKTIAVVLAAGRRNKEWPVQSYVSVIERLQKEMPIQVVLLGAGEPSISYGKVFCDAVPDTINLINRTTLRESAEILRKCDCYLGGDTGLMHIAATLKIPGIALFANHLDWMREGIDTPDRFGPWNSPIICIQPPCAASGEEEGFVECLYIGGISVELVQENLAHIIKKQCGCEGDCYFG